MRSFILHFSYLAFDIILSLLCNLSFLGAIFFYEIPIPIFTFYVFSVWALYLTDRLLDSRLYHPRDLTARDLFIQTYKPWIYFFIFGSIVICGISSFFISISLLLRIGIIGGFLFLFLFIKVLPREIFVAVFYFLGILLPFHFKEFPFWILGLFFLHLVSNVLLTYSCDIPWDERSERNTIARRLGPGTTKRTAQFLLGLGTFFCFLIGLFLPNSGGFVVPLGSLLFSYLLLFSISLFPWEREMFKSLCELSYLPLGFPFFLNLFSSY